MCRLDAECVPTVCAVCWVLNVAEDVVLCESSIISLFHAYKWVRLLISILAYRLGQQTWSVYPASISWQKCRWGRPKARHFKWKFFWGRGTAPSPYPTPSGEGTPHPHTLPPRRFGLDALASRSRRQSSSPANMFLNFGSSVIPLRCPRSRGLTC